jgi:hypothetical protein
MEEQRTFYRELENTIAKGSMDDFKNLLKEKLSTDEISWALEKTIWNDRAEMVDCLLKDPRLSEDSINHGMSISVNTKRYEMRDKIIPLLRDGMKKYWGVG